MSLRIRSNRIERLQIRVGGWGGAGSGVVIADNHILRPTGHAIAYVVGHDTGRLAGAQIVRNLIEDPQGPSGIFCGVNYARDSESPDVDPGVEQTPVGRSRLLTVADNMITGFWAHPACVGIRLHPCASSEDWTIARNVVRCFGQTESGVETAPPPESAGILCGNALGGGSLTRCQIRENNVAHVAREAIRVEASFDALVISGNLITKSGALRVVRAAPPADAVAPASRARIESNFVYNVHEAGISVSPLGPLEVLISGNDVRDAPRAAGAIELTVGPGSLEVSAFENRCSGAAFGIVELLPPDMSSPPARSSSRYWHNDLRGNRKPGILFVLFKPYDHENLG